MVFTSPRFLLFLAGLLLLLGLAGSRETKKRILAAASCFFYAAWDWRYLGLLLLVAAVGHASALRIRAAGTPRLRRAWLWASVAANLGVLGWFKYCDFFIGGFNDLFGWAGASLPALGILLPAGVSFYTFKTMSYTIDVYRGELEPCRDLLDYATFVTFFPELIAGPIVRGSVFLPQLGRDIGPSRERLVHGASLFFQGLLKKLLIADRLAAVADPIFADPQLFAPATIWCGVLAYTLQIYCDFSGYSDMAIGAARMIGYDLPENFAMPYLSRSIGEFWRRWHMTLSSWLRDYLYIPLGGSRGGPAATCGNLVLTMLLGGLWHGASWNFVLWGGLHGAALAVQRLWSGARRGKPPLPAWLGWTLTLLFVAVAWVLFRARTPEAAQTMLGKMFGLGDPGGAVWWPTWLGWCAALVVLGHAAGALALRKTAAGAIAGLRARALAALGLDVHESAISGAWLVPARPTVAGAYCATLLLLIVFYFAPLVTNPFIYFQF